VQGFWEELMNFHALTTPNIANFIQFFNELLAVQQALIMVFV
jgi:hypothetical protein